MDDDIWPDFPVILGQGSLHDLRDEDRGTPRLSGLRSVSQAAAWAMHKKPAPKPRQAGFVRNRPA
jgi:hypothetical protein